MHVKHKWSKWERVPIVITPGPLTMMMDRTAQPEIAEGQTRACRKCGREQLRRIGEY